MYSLTKPTLTEIQKHLEQQGQQPFSYPDVEASCRILANSDWHLSNRYTIDHNRVLLGKGAEVFKQSKAALGGWKMFQLDWVQLFWSETPIQVGSTVGILIQTLGLWSLNACRIVCVVQEQGSTERFGFAYGTLPDHGLCGEERFVVEWCHCDDTVWYDLFAFSRPNQLISRIGYWYVRRLQKRFASGSLQAMVKSIS